MSASAHLNRHFVNKRRRCLARQLHSMPFSQSLQVLEHRQSHQQLAFSTTRVCTCTSMLLNSQQACGKPGAPEMQLVHAAPLLEVLELYPKQDRSAVMQDAPVQGRQPGGTRVESKPVTDPHSQTRAYHPAK